MGRPKGSKNKPKVSVTPSVTAAVSTPLGTKTVNEIKANITNDEDDKYKKERLKEIFAETSKALQLVDLTKSETRTYTVYNRDLLRTYLKSPKAYESQLRNVSRYLYRLSYEFRRMCMSQAKMVCGEAFSIVPNIDLASEVSDEDILNNYYETLTRWQRMDFKSEILKLLITAWREDTVYAYIYDDSDQEGGTCFFHILDGDYCRVSSIEEGVLRFAFDFSYFRKYKTDLEMWDSEFQTKYNAYDKDSTLRWQELDPERQICLKVNFDDPKMDYPPFAPLFERLCDILDLSGIQHIKDSLSIYKLLVARLKPLSGTDEPDDFEVDVDTAIKYYNKLADSLPPEVAACISPLPIEPIEFNDSNTTKDSDMLSSANNNLFKTIGGGILSNEKTGTTIYEAQIISDMELGQSTLVDQINRWLNLYYNYTIGEGHAFIKYISGVSPYTKKAKRKELLESAQNGLPTILEVSALDGSNPYETISKLKLQKALGLPDQLTPLMTSYTQSGKVSNTDAADPITGGAPTKDATELTDEGSNTREK